jgi:pimeloyl-ACP methyl ester carboxylesterase
VGFVLVHGGLHAAWCWSRTTPELEQLGHQAIAVDLPGHGDRVEEESTLENRPFLSRPKALAELLVHAATTKPVGPLDPN